MICTAAGAVFSSALKRRCSKLRALLSLTEDMAARIRYFAVPLPELMTALAEERAYADLGFPAGVDEGLRSGRTVQEAWSEAADNVTFLSEGDRAVLHEIGARLGDSDTEGQLAMLSHASEMLGRSLGEAEREYSQKARAVLSVWMLCGIGAGIVIV